VDHYGLTDDQFRQLVELAPDAMLGVAADGRIVWVNARSERLFGYARAELLERPVEILLPEALRAVHVRHRATFADDPHRRPMGLGLDLSAQRKDGTTFPAEISLVPLETAQGLLVTAVVRDLTERRRDEAERLRLVRERAEAEIASRTKDQFLATLSHELRTPLQAILGWVRMLRSGSLDETVASRALETIERNARIQARLIDDLLDVSRIVSGKVQLDCRIVELSLMMDAAIDAVRATAYSRRIRLHTLVDPTVGAIWGDPERLQQVVGNLVSNAVKFTPDGGKVEVRVEPGSGDTARIVVTDTGKGIEPSLLDHVFERFAQGDRTERLQGGLGLGLAIVRNLVELHGGTVTADSVGENRGARFVVTLPLAGTRTQEPVAAAAPAPDASARDTAASLDGLRVLVVDDEPDTLEVVGAALRHAGAKVTSASSAAEAMQRFAESTPDILISDLAMPGENGFDLIGRIRAFARELGGAVPAVALSAFTGAEDRRHAMNAGFQLYVAKPVEPLELVRLVRSLSPEARANGA
jgi:PAS domain S-box-containing protein